MLRIAVLVSGGGTNLQALIDAQKAGKLGGGEITGVISNKPGVYALERAANAGISSRVVCKKDFSSAQAYDKALADAVSETGAELVVLAGFLSILGSEFLSRFDGRILNIHPSLIPSFCGMGYYGLKVHEAVLERGVKVTGATVHFVSEIPDGGPIVYQKSVDVNDDDTPETLQKRVMENAEWIILPRAVAAFCEGRLKIVDGKVRIKA